MIFFTLLKQAMKAKRTQWLVYSAMGFGFLLLYVSVFPSVQSQSQMYDSLYASLPKGLIAAFNITNVSPTLMGFLSSKHFGLAWALMITLLVISYGSFSIAKEIETKTMGLLIAQPIARTKLYIARFSAGAIGLAIFICASEIAVWPMAKLFSYAIDIQSVLLIGIVGFLFGLSVLSLSMMFSAVSNTAARVDAYTGAVLVAMYAAFIISSLVTSLDNIKYLSLFHYFAPGDIVSTGSIAMSSIAVFIVLSIVTTFVGVQIFKRRQIQV